MSSWAARSMSETREVVAVVEGYTEQVFVDSILAVYLKRRSGVLLSSVVVGPPGQQGGDVRFARVNGNLDLLMRESEAFVTLLVDYYGIGTDWPGYEESKKAGSHTSRARIVKDRTAERVVELYGECGAADRFVPYVSMFEMEALLFTDPKVLSEHLGIPVAKVAAVLQECGEPERIDDSPQGAPSKRLLRLNATFRKKVTGIAIAREIGIEAMRTACPLFGEWVTTLERLGAVGR